MSAFEFFFSFYGLILGLSVVEVITGFSRVFKARSRIAIGYVTPLLALVVLLDIASFWASAWNEFQGVPVSYGLLLVGMAVAATYYFAASQVFPDVLGDWESLDDFYARHKRYVIGGITFANFAVFDVARLFTAAGRERFGEIWADPLMIALSYGYYLLMVGLFISKSRRIDAGLLILLVAFYVHTAVEW